MVNLSDITQQQINLPLVGGVSVLAVGVVGLALFLAFRRKKSISLKF